MTGTLNHSHSSKWRRTAKCLPELANNQIAPHSPRILHFVHTFQCWSPRSLWDGSLYSRACLPVACWPCGILRSHKRECFLQVWQSITLPRPVIQHLLCCIHPPLLPHLPFYLYSIQRLRILKDVFNNLWTSSTLHGLGLVMLCSNPGRPSAAFPPKLWAAPIFWPSSCLLLLVASIGRAMLPVLVHTHHSSILASANCRPFLHLRPLPQRPIELFFHASFLIFTRFPQAHLSSSKGFQQACQSAPTPLSVWPLFSHVPFTWT